MLCDDQAGGLGVGGRPEREGMYVHLQLIHFVVQQKLTQHCKAVILQLKKNQSDVPAVITPYGEDKAGIKASMLRRDVPGLSGRESTCPCRRHGFDPGSGRCPGEGNSNPLQYSCLEKSHGRRSLEGTARGGIIKSQT